MRLTAVLSIQLLHTVWWLHTLWLHMGTGSTAVVSFRGRIVLVLSSRSLALIGGLVFVCNPRCGARVGGAKTLKLLHF